MIRCRIVTELGLTADEAGAMDFPFVTELHKYWKEFPPAHVLLRMLAHYDPRPEKRGNWPSRNRREMMDDTKQPEPEPKKLPKVVDTTFLNTVIARSRHMDCAPGHIQEAIERAKRGEHMNVPNSK